MTNRPTIVVVGGPNGAGKSTTAPHFIRDLFNISIFVNADVIASGLSGFNPSQAGMQAGRIMLARIKELGEKGKSFAFESTLAGRNFAPFLNRLKADAGYHVHILFLWLRSQEQAIARVRERILTGGHGVPEEVVRRRYKRGLSNFFGLYEPIAESWVFLDNSNPEGPRMIASRESGGDPVVFQTRIWQDIKKDVED